MAEDVGDSDKKTKTEVSKSSTTTDADAEEDLKSNSDSRTESDIPSLTLKVSSEAPTNKFTSGNDHVRPETKPLSSPASGKPDTRKHEKKEMGKEMEMSDMSNKRKKRGSKEDRNQAIVQERPMYTEYNDPKQVSSVQYVSRDNQAYYNHPKSYSNHSNQSRVSQQQPRYRQQSSLPPINMRTPMNHYNHGPVLYPLMQKVEENYRMFAFMKASDDPTFVNIGNVQAEAILLFERIRLELQRFGLTMSSIVRVDVRIVNFNEMHIFDRVFKDYFPGEHEPQPLKNVFTVSALPNDCSIECEFTASRRNEVFSPPAQNRAPRSHYDRMSDQESSSEVNSHVGSPVGPRNIPFSQETPFSQTRPPQPTSPNPPNANPNQMNIYDNSPKPFCNPIMECLGDILPPTLALAYGFYGEYPLRLRACMKLMVGVRLFTCTFSIASFSQVMRSNWDQDEERAAFLGATATFLLSVGIAMFIHSFCSLIYVIFWLYQNSLVNTPGYLFTEEVPAFMVHYHFVFVYWCYYGDLIFIILGLSSFSALVPLLAAFKGNAENEENEELEVHRILLMASLLMLGSWLIYLMSYSVSKKGKSAFRGLGNKITVSTTNNSAASEPTTDAPLTGSSSNQQRHYSNTAQMPYNSGGPHYSNSAQMPYNDIAGYHSVHSSSHPQYGISDRISESKASYQGHNSQHHRHSSRYSGN